MKRMKVSLLLLVALSLFVLAACGGNDEDVEEDDVDTVETEPAEQVVDKSETVTYDEDLEAELEAEEGVVSVNLIITEDGGQMALLDINVNEDVDEAKAEELANQFATQVQDAYPEYTTDVKVYQNEEKIAEVTLDVE